MDIDLNAGLIVQKDDYAQLMGELHFTFLSNKKVVSIDQIFVNPEFRNQGLARQLLQAGIDLAIEHQCKILPVCPFARAVFKHETQLRPLLALEDTDNGSK